MPVIEVWKDKRLSGFEFECLVIAITVIVKIVGPRACAKVLDSLAKILAKLKKL